MNTCEDEQKIILSLKKWSCHYLSNYIENYTSLKDLLNIDFSNTIAQITGKSLEDSFLVLSIEDETFKGSLKVKNKSMSNDWYNIFNEDNVVKINSINRTYIEFKNSEKEFVLTQFSNIMLLPKYSYLYTAFIKKKENSLIDMDEIIYTQEDLLRNEEYILKSEQKLKGINGAITYLP